MPDFRVADSDPAFLPGCETGFKTSLDPDPGSVFKFLWIRIRFLYQDSGSRIWLLGAKIYRNCSSKKLMTRDRQKI